MDEDKLEALLTALDSEIDRKCLEIRKKKQEQRNFRMFVFACGLFILIPVLMVFAGINLVFVIFPAALFFAFMLIVLSPIVINNNLGGITQ